MVTSPSPSGDFLSDEESIFDLTTAHLNTGMRGIPLEHAEHRSLHPQKVCTYCGYPISELAMMSPEDIVYLLFHKELPNLEQSSEFRENLQSRGALPPGVKRFLQLYQKMATLWTGYPLEYTHLEC